MPTAALIAPCNWHIKGANRDVRLSSCNNLPAAPLLCTITRPASLRLTQAGACGSARSAAKAHGKQLSQEAGAGIAELAWSYTGVSGAAQHVFVVAARLLRNSTDSKC